MTKEGHVKIMGNAHLDSDKLLLVSKFNFLPQIYEHFLDALAQKKLVLFGASSCGVKCIYEFGLLRYSCCVCDNDESK
jgi:hypothetical protein